MIGITADAWMPYCRPRSCHGAVRGSFRKSLAVIDRPSRRVRPVVAAPQIFGSDISPQTLRSAVDNFNAAGVGNVIRARAGDLLKLDAPCAEPGIMIANPPYGERIGNAQELDLFYPELGHVLKNNYAGWNCYFISADRRMEKLIRLKASRRTPLMNGDLDCRLYEFKMVAGGNRRPAAPDASPAQGATPG